MPPRFQPVLLAASAVVVTIVAWAAFGASTISNDSSYATIPLVNAAEFRSVAYFEPAPGNDLLRIRHLNESAPGRLLNSFPSTFDLHARGAASPLGDAIAVLSVSPSESPYASLSLVELPAGSLRHLDAPLDYLSPIVWSPDGARLVARRSSLPDEAGRVAVTIVEVTFATGETRDLAQFENAFDAAPLGYSLDADRLFVVVLDQSGSTLWALRDGRPQRLASLALGRTRDWSLSPDGSRLAYIEQVGAGERVYAGRTVTIATGAISASEAGGNQFGTAWLPGSQVPMFGGPGGSLQLSGASGGAAFVVPLRWAPDGSTLAGTVYPNASERAATTAPSLQLLTTNSRTELSPESGASFVGWVRDFNQR
ncbi:MAG: hypothetical protein ABIP13_11405 [Tepidiformaceae bacterium]